MAPLVDHVFPLLRRETAAEEAGEALNRRLTIGVVVTCLMLSIISFSLRIYGRMYSRAKLWLDDYWMMAVMVLCFAMSACDFVGLAFGSGRHQASLEPEMMLKFMKNLYSYMLLWAMGVFAVKIGILLFYWRVFPTRGPRVAVIVVACLSAGIFLSNFFSFMFQCLPISKFWNPLGPGTCFDQNSFYLSSAIINVVGDVAVLSLPLPVVWNLHTSKNKKWSLSFLFLLGAFVCVASIFRIIAVKEIDPEDFTFTNVAGGLWSTVEVEIGFICANLPAIRPLVTKWFGRGGGASYGTGTSGSAYGNNSKLGGSRAGRLNFSSKNRDGDLELMTQGNSSDEINLTKAGHITDSGSEANVQNGIRVQTEVAMTWDKNDRKHRGVSAYVNTASS